MQRAGQLASEDLARKVILKVAAVLERNMTYPHADDICKVKSCPNP